MNTTTQTSAAKTHGENAGAEPSKFAIQIGSTDYRVSVRFSELATETFEDKVLRLIEREVLYHE
jgi:hypothetical protein